MSYREVLTKACILIIPISVLFYNFTSSKIDDYEQSENAYLMTAFLLLYSSLFCYKHREYLHYREVGFLLLFFFSSLPAFLLSNFFGLSTYLRYFAIISFIPLGFMTGVMWGHYYYYLRNDRKDKILTILLIPAAISIVMIVNSALFSVVDSSNRDYVFGVIFFLPLILYFKNSFFSTFLLAIALFVCVFSAKRTGIICIASIILFYILIKINANGVKLTNFIFVLLIVSLIFVYFIDTYMFGMNSLFEESLGRLNNIDDASNDARTYMYGRVIAEVVNSNVFGVLFGHGCLSTVMLFGNPTHNDWLEILYDFGLIPFLFIFVFFVSLFFRAILYLRRTLPASLILMSTLLIFLITTIFNCIITNYADSFILLFTLGFALINLQLSKS